MTAFYAVAGFSAVIWLIVRLAKPTSHGRHSDWFR